MKTFEIKRCGVCPFFHEDYSGIEHRAECWLDVDIIPHMKRIPYQCPLKKYETVEVKLDASTRLMR